MANTPTCGADPLSKTAQGESIAVVGGGIAGLAAAYLLTEQGKRVVLFESEATCGGHALTVDTEFGPIDLGFQVCATGCHRSPVLDWAAPHSRRWLL